MYRDKVFIQVGVKMNSMENETKKVYKIQFNLTRMVIFADTYTSAWFASWFWGYIGLYNSHFTQF